MTAPAIWISTVTNAVAVDDDNPGNHWQGIGVIDTAPPSDFYTHIQVAIGKRQTAKGQPEFYVSGDPASPWVHQARRDPTGQEPFWILVNPYGDSPIQYGSESIKYLVSSGKATIVRSLTARKHTAHPGLRVTPVMIAVRMQRRDESPFTPVRAAKHRHA